MKKILVYLMFASHAAKRAALQDAQDVAALVLDAEMKLGEMLADITPVFDSNRHILARYSR